MRINSVEQRVERAARAAASAARELEYVAPIHGARASHQHWAARGFNSRNSASCNTFTASASKVS
jgi:predicted metalloprotease